MSNEQINKKTIEELENDYWVTPLSFQTELTKSIFFLRKKRLIDFDSNDLRILISQDIGVKYLIPKAINLLKENILEEASYYPGDLLSTLLNLDYAYWLKNKVETNQLISLLNISKANIYKSDIINAEIKKDLTNSIDKFIVNVSG
jgi:hypothetical protein